MFKGKDKGYNIWPFYHHDAQLGCMKEYHAVSAKIFKSRDKRRKLCHAYLHLKFEKFRATVKH